MTFVPENPLEEALARAKSDVLARPVFYQLLMSEPLVVAGEIVRQPDGGEMQGMNLAVIRHNGRDFHPIFTSFTRLRAVAPDEKRHFLAVGRDLFQRTKGADFALNPSSEVGKVLMATEIAFWLDPSARARRALQRHQPHIIVTVPKGHSKKLVEALSILFVNRHDVIQAHLLEVAFSDRNEPPHPLVVIQTEGDWGKISSEVSQLAAAVVPDTILDVVPHSPSHPDPRLVEPLAAVRPFFQRKPE
ncbi:MAG TPA: enhanced serine sensitivity protein SseB C-terminal domain-containing protein [Rhizomicrobium sp.]|nr:enhanced serine sensitivity protein SseB C-terminal domain-containing protein [Rhizomicrobium sp.]